MALPRLKIFVIASALALVGLACGGDDGDPSPAATTAATGTAPTSTSPSSQTPAPAGTLDSVAVRLTKVAQVTQPVDLAVRAGDTALYVVEKVGRVQAVRDGAVDPTAVLDLSSAVSTGSEQGLLGMAFSPDGGHLYVDYTDTAGDTRIVEYAFTGGRADPSSARELLEIDQPYANHNGGHLTFGPDGNLWIGMGDGGSGNDPENRAQNLGTLLGKLLRINPNPYVGGPYMIPPDNPFVGEGGARDEIWAFGLRNPWRFSFDRETGDLWIGDVGQDAVEEVDFDAGSKGGQNYGWPGMEGTRANKGVPPAGAVDPLFDYRQADGGCSVVGGYVYRGTRIPALAGAFLYGDYCAGNVLVVRQSGGQVTEQADLGLHVDSLSSFGQDGAGELYALSLDGPLYRVDPA